MKSINAPTHRPGYDWWNGAYTISPTYLIRERSYSVPSKTTTVTSALTANPLILTTLSYNMNNMKLYYEIEFSGNNMAFSYEVYSLISLTGRINVFFINPTRIQINFIINNETYVSEYTVSPNPIINTLQIAMQQTPESWYGISIGLNNNWLKTVNNPIRPWEFNYHGFIHRHGFGQTATDPTPANPLTITLKTKSTEFTYAPPTGYVGLDDFVT